MLNRIVFALLVILTFVLVASAQTVHLHTKVVNPDGTPKTGLVFDVRVVFAPNQSVSLGAITPQPKTGSDGVVTFTVVSNCKITINAQATPWSTNPKAEYIVPTVDADMLSLATTGSIVIPFVNPMLAKGDLMSRDDVGNVIRIAGNNTGVKLFLAEQNGVAVFEPGGSGSSPGAPDNSFQFRLDSADLAGSPNILAINGGAAAHFINQALVSDSVTTDGGPLTIFDPNIVSNGTSAIALNDLTQVRGFSIIASLGVTSDLDTIIFATTSPTGVASLDSNGNFTATAIFGPNGMILEDDGSHPTTVTSQIVGGPDLVSVGALANGTQALFFGDSGYARGLSLVMNYSATASLDDISFGVHGGFGTLDFDGSGNFTFRGAKVQLNRIPLVFEDLSNNLNQFSVTGASGTQTETINSPAGGFNVTFPPTGTIETTTGDGSGLTNLNASNISSGTLAGARLPNPSASVLGGIESIVPVSHNFLTSISTSGVPAQVQPVEADVTNLVSDLAGKVATSTTVNSHPLSANVTITQSDVGLSNVANVDTTNASNISSGALADARLSSNIFFVDGTRPGVSTSATGTAFELDDVSLTSGILLKGKVHNTGVTGDLIKVVDDAGSPATLFRVAHDGSILSGSIPYASVTSKDVVNADVDPAAAIAYSKLNLAGSIVNADVASGAAIANSKIAGLAASATTDTTNASNISSGTLAGARLPNPSASVLGGIESIAAVSHNFLTSISTSGVPAQAQPVDADISFSDVPTGNASASAHGYLPKLPNDTSKFLRGDGTYTTVPASGVTSITFSAPLTGGTVTSTGTAGLDVSVDHAFTHSQSVKLSDAGTTTAPDVLVLNHASSGTPASLFGTTIHWKGQDTTTSDVDMAGMLVRWIGTPTHNSANSEMTFQGVFHNTLADFFTLAYDGASNSPMLTFQGFGELMNVDVIQQSGSALNQMQVLSHNGIVMNAANGDMVLKTQGIALAVLPSANPKIFGVPNGVDFGYSGGTAFASLSSFNNGAIVFCSDCKNFTDDAAVVGSAAVASGHGAHVGRVNGGWRTMD